MAETGNAPTVRANKGPEFYNGGDHFSEPLNYSIEGWGDIHAVARWIVDAPAEGFFRVPTELKLLADGNRLPVDFPSTVITKFKDRGVVMIDDEWIPTGDEDEDDKQPFARSREEASEKGKRVWRKYLETIVRNHISLYHRARALGGIPIEAEGFTKRAFKLLRIADPAALVFNEIAKEQVAPQQNAEVASLRTQIEQMSQTVQQLQGIIQAAGEIKRNDEIEERATKKKARAA